MDAVPSRVLDLALGLGADPDLGPAAVRLSQRGRMRQGPSSRWMAYRATQSIHTRECRFDWRARTGPGGLVIVRDALAGGRGRLDARLLGIVPLARAAASPEVTRGELMRYLAELAWAPDAMIHNPQLRWIEDGPDRLKVGAGEAMVTLFLDAEGRVGRVEAPDRPRAVGRAFVPTPWRGRFLDYRLRERRWLPSRAEVGWVIDGAEVTCWEGRVADWRLTPLRAAGRPSLRRSPSAA